MTTLRRYRLLRWVDLDGQYVEDSVARITSTEWTLTRRHLKTRPDRWAVIWEGDEDQAEALFDSFEHWAGFEIGIRRNGSESQVIARYLGAFVSTFGLVREPEEGAKPRRPPRAIRQSQKKPKPATPRPVREPPKLTTSAEPVEVPRPRFMGSGKTRCSCGRRLIEHTSIEYFNGCKNLQ